MPYTDHDLETLVSKVGLTSADRSTGEWLTASEAAELLGITRQGVHNAINRDTLPALRLHHHGEVVAVIIPRSEVERYRVEHLRKAC